MNILCIGDVFGEAGCNVLQKALPAFKKQKNIDMVICNGENSAVGNGITPASARHLLNCGVDIITGGNHSLRRGEIADLLEGSSTILRPDNLIDDAPGSGFAVVDFGHTMVGVINLMGAVYADGVSNPFLAADRLLEEAKALGLKIVVVDFHAEATSEKKAMGYYLDGKVSAMFGTHTHIATADEQIMPCGTGYITDIGMTGVEDSVLGVQKDIIISRLRDDARDKFMAAEGTAYVNGCIFDIDKSTGRCVGVERVRFN